MGYRVKQKSVVTGNVIGKLLIASSVVLIFIAIAGKGWQ